MRHSATKTKKKSLSKLNFKEISDNLENVYGSITFREF